MTDHESTEVDFCWLPSRFPERVKFEPMVQYAMYKNQVKKLRFEPLEFVKITDIEA